MAILEVRGIKKRFGGVHAVDGLSVEFESGRITSIVGPNGSGKSTLMNLLSGVVPFDAGTIVVQGETLSGLKAYDAPAYGITRTFQEVRLFNQMTVIDNLMLAFAERHAFAALFEGRTKHYEHRAQELLTKVNLWDKRHEVAGGLSYGQRKLLEIVRALAMESQIYLFDEPFAGLFPQMITIITEIMKELRIEGRTVILIEHNMEIVREISDHVIVMDGGELLAEGKPETVLSEKEVVEAYLGK